MKTVIKQHLHLSIADASAHLIQAELILSLDQDTSLTLALPRWIPGSYLLRDFAKHIQHLCAVDAQEQPIALYRTSISTWHLDASAGEVRIRYQVYAFDQSVRACYVTQGYAFINPAAAAFYVMEWRDHPYHLTLHDSIASGWQVFTSLARQQVDVSGFGHYLAKDYDDFIEHPILMGHGRIMSWQSAGIAHQMVLVDEAPIERLDAERLITDLQTICEQQQRFWGNPAPYSHYLFQVMVTTDGYGGLEHSNSTALLISRDSLPYQGQGSHKGYEDFLGLCSHEYFHAWMVKRIRPQVFIRPNLQDAVISSLLWIFEGFTSLYDDWFLFRSERIGSQQLLTRWSDTLSRALLTQGIAVQSVADASREAWIKYYQPTENSINSQVSYYTQGASLALALLCELVAQGKHLDDLLHLWWQAWQSAPQQGMKENQLSQDLNQLAEHDWADWIEAWVEQPATQLAEHLRQRLPILGLRLSETIEPQAGWKVSLQQGKLLVKQVLLNSPAHLAGVQVNDEIIALNQWRCDSTTQLEQHMTQCASNNSQMSVMVARKGYLTTLSMTLISSVLAYQLQFDHEDHSHLAWLKGARNPAAATPHTAPQTPHLPD